MTMIRETKTTLPTSLFSQELGDIVAAASTLAERLNGDFLAEETPESEALRQQRFDTWCRIVAAGDRGRFQEVLSWDGLDITEFKHLLGRVRLREHALLPDWTRTLQEVLRQVETTPRLHSIVDKSSWSFLIPDKPCPFEELLSPFVAVAQRRYTEQAGSASHLLSAQAHCTLQRHLLQVLTSLSVDALYTAFSHWRSQMPVPSAEQVVQQVGDVSGEYQQFIECMYEGGLVAFFRTYSFLARLLATTTDLWIESNVEFLRRLEADWRDIQQTFGGDTSLERVIAIEPALSDPHHGRRSVMALTFASGERLVYKPRNIGMEVSYARLLSWCNEQGATPPLKSLATLDRSTYGWVEFVAHEPCQDVEAAQRYYQRAGMLLCLAYVLGGVDCSYEHIIAHGEHPVLIDPTILLHHYPCPDHQDEPCEKQCADWEQQEFSVLHTGLLANWQMSMDATRSSPGIDISGLAMNDSRIGADHERALSQSRSSVQVLKHGMVRLREHLNVPMYDNNPLPPEKYQQAIYVGFMHLYQLLLSKRSLLLAADSPLQTFKQQSVRVVYRASQAYHALLSKLMSPAYMCDGAAYNIEMERLWHEHIPVEYRRWREGNSARWRLVYLAEQQALLRGDIPFFTAQVGSAVLLTDRSVTSCLHQPSFDLLLQRLTQLSAGDMHVQVRLIQRTLQTQVTPVVLDTMNDTPASDNRSAGELPTSAVLLAQALAIADGIGKQAIHIDNGGITWIQPRFLSHSHRNRLQPIRHSTFNGRCGVALFLAAAARISGADKYRVLARAAVQPVCRSLREDGELVAREMGIGGALGLGSVVYALTRISRFLDDAALLEVANEAAHLIDAGRIAHDEALDVIAGSAGAILGLLALYEVSRDQAILERAITCGNHLLQARTMSRAGCLAWPTLGKMHTTGFSHGTAGIVYALSRLYAATGDSRLLSAAREGLIYEDHAFLSEAGNWAEMLTDEKPAWVTWCHGAPGIGLARIGGLPVLDSPRIRQDIEVALQTTQQMRVAGHDNLCCGNSGRAEILLAAAQKLARPELAAVARRNMGSILTRAQRRGTFLLDASLPAWVPLIDLFGGTSGIGYMLLRMVSPDILPSLLLWE